ncbi:MAG: co-chaperone DjlA [Synergistales bacterium]|nr:co-chaperone DjlA [Synergistales bacterium]
MSWWGKVLFGGVGAALGGPLGAIIGGALGHQMIDAKSQGQVTGRQKTEAAFFAAYFSSLGKIAKADGRVSPEEVAVVEDIISRRLRLNPEGRRAAIAIFNEAKSTEVPIGQYVRQFGEIFRYDREACTTFLLALIEVAAADHRLHQAELDCLYEAEEALRLPRGTVDAYLGRAGAGAGSGSDRQAEAPGQEEQSLKEAYTILDCFPEMGNDEIKAAYRRKIKEFHPDTIQSKGLPAEFTDFANEQLARINRAYERIARERGMK